YAEMLLREAVGDPTTPEEYCSRFPHLSDRVRRLFKLHHALNPTSAIVITPPPATVDLPGLEIIEEIGRGGMGVVYKARQLDLNRVVAVKMLRTDGADPEW